MALNDTFVLAIAAFVLFAISLSLIEKIAGYAGVKLPQLLRYALAIVLVFVGFQAWHKLPARYVPHFNQSESESAVYSVPPTSDTDCPSTHPVKGNFTTSTGHYCIYSVPGDDFYRRTRPGRCYASVGDAEEEGCKRSHL